MLSRLTDCSILMLRMILDLYLTQKITRDELLKLSETKVNFLTNNIDKIQSEKEKMRAVDILEQIKSFMSQDVNLRSVKPPYSSARAVNQDHLAHL